MFFNAIRENKSLAKISEFNVLFPASFIQYTWDSPLYILRGHRSLFPKNIVFHSLKIHFVLANSADPDDMLHNWVFAICQSTLPLGYKTFSMLKSAKHEIYPAHKC